MPKESNLVRKTTAANTDLVRMVVDSMSVDVSVSDFASIISSSLSSIVSGVTMIARTSTGSISLAYNVELCSGTITRTLPSPATAFNAATSKSITITVVNTGSSGTVTVNPYDSESIFDGGAQTSIALSAGSKATFATDGSNWYVIGS